MYTVDRVDRTASVYDSPGIQETLYDKGGPTLKEEKPARPSSKVLKLEISSLHIYFAIFKDGRRGCVNSKLLQL